MTTTIASSANATKATTAIPALQISSRLRLTEEQRQALKAAFQAMSTAHKEVQSKGISVVTRQSSSVEAELGMDSLTFSSLIASRDSMAIPLVLRLQRVLGVQLIDEKELKASFASYVKHLKETHGL